MRDIVEIIGGGTPNTNIQEYWDGDIDWYSPTEIGLFIYAEESCKKITRLGLEKSSAKLLPANRTVLFTSRASIGDRAILKKEGATNQGFQSLVVKGENHIYFLYTIGDAIKEYAIRHASGSTFLEISGKELSKMQLRYPTVKEQIQIGNFFQKFDELITLHRRKSFL